MGEGVLGSQPGEVQRQRQRQRVLAQIDQGIGSGHWRQQRLDQLTDEGMSDAVSTLVSTVAARAVKAALSGDQGQVAALGHEPIR